MGAYQHLSSAAVWIAITVVVILLLRLFLRSAGRSPEEMAQMHIEMLKLRYSRGEIDQETYERNLKTLKGEIETPDS